MTTQTIFYVILGLFIFEFVLTKFVSYLNTRKWSDTLPEEGKKIYDEKKYRESMVYEKTKHTFQMISGVFSFIVMLLVIIYGGFGLLDSYVREFSENNIIIALLFFGIIFLIQTIINVPFSYYSTFVIEEKFGFNKMTKKIFFTDMIKGMFITIILGGGLLSLFVWIYGVAGDSFWIYAWVVMTLFSVFMMMFYSSVIVPLFNKQTPLEKGKLRDAIENFAKKVGFQLDNIYVIDGSKRSSKANAYFAGFGPKKRIVLYDTLIKDLSIDELVGVLAHEIGHYKKKHTIQMLAYSIIQTGVMFYILGLTLKYEQVSMALGASEGSFWVGIIAFTILFTPLSIFLSILGNVFSRRNEYQADAFAAQNYKPLELQNALIKLSRNNLANLTPHPIYEFFYYSHPTVLKRLEALSLYENKKSS